MKRRYWIIWYAIIMHFWWGVTLLLTKPAPMYMGTRWFIEHGGPNLWGTLLIIGALLAAVGVSIMKSPFIGVLLLLWQQSILYLSLFGLIQMGYLREIPFTLFCLALGYVLPIAILHTLAIMEKHVWAT